MSAGKTCPICAARIQHIDYKNVPLLSQFLTERAKIVPRRLSGVCARHQRQLARAIKRARFLALLPYVPRYGAPV